YHVPLSRTVFLGKPTQEFLDAEKATLEGMEAGLAAAKPGNTCEDIANAFFAVLKDRKSTRLNSSHVKISYAVFCLKKKKLKTWKCNAANQVQAENFDTPDQSHIDNADDFVLNVTGVTRLNVKLNSGAQL